MPYDLADRQNIPNFLQQVWRVGEWLQGGLDQQVDYLNMLPLDLMPGEPVVIQNKVGISKVVLNRAKMGTIFFGARVEFLVDPNIATNIVQDEEVYFDYDKALVANTAQLDADNIYKTKVITGFATNVAPTIGIRLGRAFVHNEQTAMMIKTDATKSNRPIACPVGGIRVPVLMDFETPVTAGAIPAFNG